MRVAIFAMMMVSLGAAACGGSTPAPATEASDATPAPGPAAAPTPDSPYKTDLEAWCNAPSRAPGAATASKDDRPLLLATWISAQLKTDEANALMQRLGTMAPGSRHEVLRKEIEGQGITTCPMLDEMP